ncbi:MAG: methyltransferase [Bdellovibrionales bacterium]|nr:methyltransferase [Bdellovibrionales bacterium]
MSEKKVLYSREEHPEAWQLVREHEALHTEHKEPIHVTVKGIELTVTPGVFRPDLSMMGQHLVEKIGIHRGEAVLDLGTGCGFQALLAARTGAGSVIAVDNQKEAVACALENVQRFSLNNRIQIRLSNLFEHILPSEQFDVILFNFPFPPFEPETPWQRANFDPGHRLLKEFFTQAKSHLTPTGRIGMCWSDIGDTHYLHALAVESGYELKVLDERKAGSIGAYVFELRMKS